MIGANRYIGNPVERIEDLRFLRGRGEFVGDLRRPGMLGGFKRSSQHGVCWAMEATGQAPLRAFSSRASFGAWH
jgi:carbon-monoxide dehydrogenase large subunit